jgi:site-specific DNA recombinase
MGAVPYGYRADEHGRLEIVPEEADTVRDIIANVAAGSTLYAEAKRLTNLGVPTPGWRYGSRARKPGARSWSVATVSNIVRQRAYSGTHEVRINGGEELIEQAVPAVVDATLQERAKVALTQNKRYPHRKGYRKYFLSGLAKCAACGAAYSGHTSTKRGKKYHYYTCHASRTNNLGADRSHKPPYVNAGWLEQLVWADLRRFMANPGEVLERVREQLDTGDNTEELEAR